MHGDGFGFRRVRVKRIWGMPMGWVVIGAVISLAVVAGGVAGGVVASKSSF